MSKNLSLKNRDRFIQMGIAISAFRKMRGMSQEELAAEANISRSHLSAIEAPNIIRAFSMEAFYNIADALKVDPRDLINAAMVPDELLDKKENQPVAERWHKIGTILPMTSKCEYVIIGIVYKWVQ